MSKIIQYNSIGQALRKILRDIRILNESIQDDLEEWVAEALEEMRTTHQMLPQEKDLNVVNYRAKIPCGVDSIQAVAYRGTRIRYGERIGSYVNFKDHIPPPKYFTHWQVQMPQLVPNEYHQLGVPYIEKALASLQAVVTKGDCYEDYFYYIRDGYIETNMPYDDQITIYYLGVILDEDGFPKVPDNIKILNAITNYVEYKLARRGDLGREKEAQWPTLLQLWEQSSVRAMNNLEFPTPEQMQSLMNKTLGFVKPDYYNRFE